MSKFFDCPIVWTFRSAHLFYLQKEAALNTADRPHALQHIVLRDEDDVHLRQTVKVIAFGQNTDVHGAGVVPGPLSARALGWISTLYLVPTLSVATISRRTEYYKVITRFGERFKPVYGLFPGCIKAWIWDDRRRFWPAARCICSSRS